MSSSRGRPPSQHGDPHGWNDLYHYLIIHQAQLDRLGSYFVERDELAISWIDERTLKIAGRIHCRFGIFLDVLKYLEVNDRRQVRTVRYRYHAGFEGQQPRPIFRYDNAYAHRGHPDAHHKHHVDYATWTEISPPEWIGHDRWPTLAQVLDELYDWWHQTGRVLDLPDISTE